jgi:ribosomal protein S12 methylthiotransferase accessory factor
MTTDYLQERERSIAEAQAAWQQLIHAKQLECEKHDYAVNGFTSRLCYLSANNLTVRGAGKGHDLAMIDISASYEALEYYLACYYLHSHPTIYARPAEIANEYPLTLHRCNAEVFMTEADRYCEIPWIIYKDIKSSKQHVVPLAAVDLSYQALLSPAEDNFDYEYCDLYAASNGLASGATYEESVIHGILEILERDAASYFLIDAYILNKSSWIINKQSLPDDLRYFISEIEKNYRNEIVIFQMPSRFGVYVYHATFLERVHGIQPRGSGASLNTKSAMERAICELVQSYNLMHGDYVENQINIQEMGDNEIIKNFLEFDVGIILTKNVKIINFYDNSNILTQLPLSAYLNKLIDLIYSKGASLLVNTLYENGLTCTRSIIPEAEEFFLAMHYLRLKPKPAADAYIISQQGKRFSWSDFET